MDTYYSIACNDYDYLSEILNLTHYNWVVWTMEQIAEKLLKSVAEVVVSDEKILQTHDLTVINRAINEAGTASYLSNIELAYLKDFYFNTNYPGDNYVHATLDDVSACHEILQKIIKAVLIFRRQYGLPVDETDFRNPYESILDQAIDAL